MFSSPQLTLATAALAIFALCAGYVLIRGIGRLIIATFILGAAAWAAHALWLATPQWSLPPLLATALPLAAFFLVALLLRKFLRAIFQTTADSSPPARLFSLATLGNLLIALIPTTLICLIAAGVILHRGSIAELRHSDSSPFARWKASLASIFPQPLTTFLDPSTAPERLSLARFIAAQAQSPPLPVIDPTTGKPIPRAIIVADPELQGLARSGDFSTLLRHPLLDKFLHDPRVHTLIREP